MTHRKTLLVRAMADLSGPKAATRRTLPRLHATRPAPDTWNIPKDWWPWRQRAIIIYRLALGGSAQAVLARAEDNRLWRTTT